MSRIKFYLLLLFLVLSFISLNAEEHKQNLKNTIINKNPKDKYNNKLNEFKNNTNKEMEAHKKAKSLGTGNIIDKTGANLSKEVARHLDKEDYEEFRKLTQPLEEFNKRAWAKFDKDWEEWPESTKKLYSPERILWEKNHKKLQEPLPNGEDDKVWTLKNDPKKRLYSWKELQQMRKKRFEQIEQEILEQRKLEKEKLEKEKQKILEQTEQKKLEIKRLKTKIRKEMESIGQYNVDMYIKDGIAYDPAMYIKYNVKYDIDRYIKTADVMAKQRKKIINLKKEIYNLNEQIPQKRRRR